MGQHSMEPSGKGSFQAVKLQRPARTTVCSHSTRDMAAVHSIVSNCHNNGTQDQRLYSCEQLKLAKGLHSSFRFVLTRDHSRVFAHSEVIVGPDLPARHLATLGLTVST